MKRLAQYFVRGFLALLPLSLSVYVIVWFFRVVERLSQQFILWMLPQKFHIPGVGFVVALILIVLLGYLTSHRIAKFFVSLIEIPFTTIPGLSTIYTSIKDLTRYLAPSDEEREKSQVVVLKIPGFELEMIGFLTRENLDDFPEPLTATQSVAVYLPMSYQIGGYTVFVPKEWIKPVDLDVQQTMRSVLTAWVGPIKSN